MSKAYTPDPRTRRHRRLSLALTVAQMEALLAAGGQYLALTDDPDASTPLRRALDRIEKVLDADAAREAPDA